MINLEWVKHGAGNHGLYAASADLHDAAHHALVTVYPVQRPDGSWSLMLINKDQTNPHLVRIAFDSAAGGQFFFGPVTMTTFGSEHYVWQADGINSHADPENPPVTSIVNADAATTFTLPKASVIVLRGQIGGGGK